MSDPEIASALIQCVGRVTRLWRKTLDAALPAGSGRRGACTEVRVSPVRPNVCYRAVRGSRYSYWPPLACLLGQHVCSVPVSPGCIWLTRPLLVLGVRRLRTSECGRELRRRSECCTARARAPRISTAHNELRRFGVLNIDSLFHSPLEAVAHTRERATANGRWHALSPREPV